MAKTEVYSWRVDPRIKMALESEARSQGTTLAEVLDRMAKQWLERRKRQNGDEEAEQARLHAAAAKYAGAISGGDPYASEKVREVVRKRVREREMRTSALVDTGAILAFLDANDRWHGACVEAFAEVRFPLLTSEAVLTELFHFVGGRFHRVEIAWKFVRSGALTLSAITDADLPSLSVLMHRYRDRPMDFADATLVHLAERESLTTILTVDVSDFQTYRIASRRRFRILPEPGMLRA